MRNCENCKKSYQDDELKAFCGKMFCDDCYIDKVMPKMLKAHYSNDAEFMNRLKDSYIARAQQFH